MSKLVHKLKTEEGFPLNLQVVPTGDVPLRDYDHWTRDYNYAIQAYAADRSRRPKERVVLDIVQAIESLCNSGHEPDPFLGEHIMLPLVQALGNLLSHDVGRLDPGRGFIVEHVYRRVEAYGIDPETGEVNETGERRAENQ